MLTARSKTIVRRSPSILVTSGQLKTAYLFAAVLACTLLGLVAFGTLSLVGMLVGRRFGSDA